MANKKGRGRPKGATNKVSGTAKENLIAVFTRIGGTAEMAKWARENLTEFYKLYGRLIPVEQKVSGSDDGEAIRHSVEVHIVDHRADQG